MADAGNRDNLKVSLPLMQDGAHECPYLPGRIAEDEFIVSSELKPSDYEHLMDQGFRRSGRIVYRPICDGCRECVPLRVPVDRFSPSRSQRRAWRRNQDLQIEIGPPRSTDEKWRIFTDYLAYQHDDAMSDEREGFDAFLYDSATETVEFVYRSVGHVVGVGIVDVCPNCLSSVFFYFDPAEARRSLGVYSALYEIEMCRAWGRSYWYAGFYVRDCRRMNYKADYRPYELLGPGGVWWEDGE
ncbi:MAG: arginyltransferase [Phycisphaerae bacterium]